MCKFKGVQTFANDQHIEKDVHLLHVPKNSLQIQMSYEAKVVLLFYWKNMQIICITLMEKSLNLVLHNPLFVFW